MRWRTAQPPLNNVFAIQRQQPDGVFATIAEVASDGIAYQHRLSDLPPGTHSYRLRQGTPHGAFAYSDIVTFTLVPEGLSIGEVFPTPFSAHTTVTFSSGLPHTVRVDLVDTSGRIVRRLYERTPPAHQPVTVHIDGGSLGSGLYHIRFLADGRVQGTRALVRIR